MTLDESIDLGESLITPVRLRNLARACEMTRGLPADMAEVGVYRGGSARVLCATSPGKTLHLYDTFCGLPHTEEEDRDPEALLTKGLFSCPREEVQSRLAGLPVVFHEGLFPETAVDAPVSFVHVDCDLYTGAKAAIDWFWPRLLDGGVMYFDDYGCKFTGVTQAVQESFTDAQIIAQTAEHGIRMGCYIQK